MIRRASGGRIPLRLISYLNPQPVEEIADTQEASHTICQRSKKRSARQWLVDMIDKVQPAFGDLLSL
jgi:hypothetical protein